MTVYEPSQTCQCADARVRDDPTSLLLNDRQNYAFHRVRPKIAVDWSVS